MAHSPQDSDRDRIAQHSATLIEAGKADRIHDAIHQAADALNLAHSTLPSHSAVRKHAQAMAMQSMGDAEYHASRRDILRIAEELMTALEQIGCESLLMGRAAAGQLDADVKLHLRLLSDALFSDLAQSLVDFGYEEPQFDTVHTMYGHLNRMRFTEQNIPIILMRCPPALNIDTHTDVFTGKSIASITVEKLRQQCAF